MNVVPAGALMVAIDAAPRGTLPAWMTFAVKDGKHFKSGELRYLPETKRYQFTAVDSKDKKLVFEGELKDEILTLERTDPDTRK